MFLDYGRVERSTVFRYYLLKNIISSAGLDVTMMLDTNQRIAGKDTTLDEDWLVRQRLQYDVMPVPNDPKMFFGFKVASGPGRVGKEPQFRIIIDMHPGTLTEEQFSMIKYNDVAIGIGRKRTFVELREAYRCGEEKLLFDPDSFEHSLYDSVFCARIRSTFDLSPHLEAVKNEMGL